MKTVLAAALALSLMLAPGDDPAFLLAVLNRDGLALPFAAYTGRRWKAPWPDHQQVELPISLESVDKDWWGIGAPPSRMAVWDQGQRAGDVTLTALAQVRTLCTARVGVRTDYKPVAPPPPRLKQPYPKDGVLLSGDASIGAVEMVPRGSAEWNRALLLIADDFNKAETRAILSFGGWRHPLSQEARRRQPITIEAIYKAASDAPGWTTYFVEAVREYPAINAARGCGLTTTGQAWLHLGPNDKHQVELSSRVTYCDRKGANVMLPFGTVRAGGKTYWVYQFSGYEDEWYQVVHPEPKKIDVAVSFHAGSCPG